MPTSSEIEFLHFNTLHILDQSTQLFAECFPAHYSQYAIRECFGNED